ncbi:MAG: hypothetical protein ACHQRM_09175 [Bacteroidia bacterium]
MIKQGFAYVCFLLLFFEGLVESVAQTNTGGGTDPLRIPSSKINIVAPKELEARPASEPVKEDAAPDSKWIIKCNPLIFIVGQVPFYVEHKLGKRYSVEAAAGPVFDNYGKETFVNGKPIFQKIPNVQQLMGGCGKLAMRYYPRQTALSELYFSPELDFTDYRKDISGVFMNSSGRYANGNLRDQQDYMDLRVIAGFQNTESEDSDFYFDWYAGIGLRVGSENNVIPEEGNPNAIRIKHTDVFSPTISVGVKIGMGF